MSLLLYNQRNPFSKLLKVEQIRQKKFQNIKYYFFEEILIAARVLKMGRKFYDYQIYPTNIENNNACILTQLIQKDFNIIFEQEILPFLHRANIDFHPEVETELNRLEPEVKEQIFEGKKTNFFIMSKAGIIKRLE